MGDSVINILTGLKLLVITACNYIVAILVGTAVVLVFAMASSSAYDPALISRLFPAIATTSAVTFLPFALLVFILSVAFHDSVNSNFMTWCASGFLTFCAFMLFVLWGKIWDGSSLVAGAGANALIAIWCGAGAYFSMWALLRRFL